MTLLQISIMAHYFCRGDEYNDGDLSAPAVREAIDMLRAEQMIEQRPHMSGVYATYQATKRGEAYIHALQALPLPVQTWVMP